MQIASIILLSTLLFFNTASSKNLQAFLAYSTFYSPEKGPFIETYLSVIGKSVIYKKNENQKFQATIEVTLSFSRNDSILYGDKYNLKSPEVQDTTDLNFNFLDQQRVSLENGKYIMGIKISDKNGSGNFFESQQAITISYPEGIINISDIELLESYKKSESPTPLTKSGYDLIPYISGYQTLFYPNTINKLKFYTEIYNAKEILGAENFVVSYYLQETGSKKIIPTYNHFSKEEAQDVNALLADLSINDLPSGNYTLVVEVRNKTNELKAFKEVLFQRSNKDKQKTTPNTDLSSVNTENTFAANISKKELLTEYIRSLRPISESNEMIWADNQLKIADVSLMQKFFYDFWQRRNPQNPEEAWLIYQEEVKKVNAAYGTRIRKGYDTDRGRVYLKYGPPNSNTPSMNEPDAYPYEIWHYYKLKNQTNRKFIFYNPDLVTNDYILLHSDALGELKNDAWQIKLHERNANRPRSIDETSPGNNHFGGKAEDNFKMPK
jgi:GWxTD domain-containing protein